jgi:hypothetical protein
MMLILDDQLNPRASAERSYYPHGDHRLNLSD